MTVNFTFAIIFSCIEHILPLQANSAAQSIQTAFRGYSTRCHFQKAVKAVICIQTHIRSYRARQALSLRKEIRARTIAAVYIQKIWRGWHAWQSYQRNLGAAVKVQVSVISLITKLNKRHTTWRPCMVLHVFCEQGCHMNAFPIKMQAIICF